MVGFVRKLLAATAAAWSFGITPTSAFAQNTVLETSQSTLQLRQMKIYSRSTYADLIKQKALLWPDFSTFRLPNLGAVTDKYEMTPFEHQQVLRCNTNRYADLWTLHRAASPDWKSLKTIELLRHHETECLMKFTPELDLGSVWSRISFQGAFSALGVLYSQEKGRISCTLSRIAQNLFISAKHCIIAQDRQNGLEVSASAENFGIVMLNEPQRQYAVTAIRELTGEAVNTGTVLTRANQATDVILFEVIDVPPGNVLSVSTSSLEKGTRLIIPGFHYHLAYGAEAEPLNRMSLTQSGIPSGWPSFMLIDPLATCSVYHSSEETHCIAHSCQTLEGWSGSPMLVARDGHVELIGIHSGLFESKSCGQGMPPTVRREIGNNVPNAGVMLKGRLVHMASR